MTDKFRVRDWDDGTSEVLSSCRMTPAEAERLCRLANMAEEMYAALDSIRVEASPPTDCDARTRNARVRNTAINALAACEENSRA